MSSRAHARRRIIAWDRYLSRYREPFDMPARAHVYLRFGRADLKWWIRANRHRRGR